MKYNKKLATIDTQDALIGNRAYDLASLIDDVRFKSNKKLKESIYNYYLKKLNYFLTGIQKNTYLKKNYKL